MAAMVSMVTKKMSTTGETSGTIVFVGVTLVTTVVEVVVDEDDEEGIWIFSRCDSRRLEGIHCIVGDNSGFDDNELWNSGTSNMMHGERVLVVVVFIGLCHTDDEDDDVLVSKSPRHVPLAP